MTLANGAGHSAVGFLKGCSQDVVAVAPASPATGSERPGLRARLRRKSLPCSSPKQEIDRCSCCTRDEFWVVYDIFTCMDRRQEGSVRRGDFVWSLSAYGANVEFQRIVRKSRLSAYFKSTAREITLEEFVRRVFPNTTPTDVTKIQRWISLRRARNIVTSAEGFGASPEALKEVFALLDEEGSGTVSTHELMRAQILTRAEAFAMLPQSGSSQMGIDDFIETVGPLLYFKYTQCGKEGWPKDWEDSLGQEVHEKFRDIIRKEREETASEEARMAETFDQELSEGKLAMAPAPLPPGVVTALVAALLPRDPEPRSCTADLDVPMLSHMEHSSVVPAF